MKSPLFVGAILPALCLGFLGLVPAPAQTTNAPAITLPPPMLDNDELTQLQKAREQVLTANPDIKAEEVKLKTMHDSMPNQVPPPTADQRNAMFAEWKAYQKKMRGLMLQIDPTLAPLFAKIDAARKQGAPSPFQPAK